MINGILDSRQKIVTNGLILNYDIAQLRSYPTTGIYTTDLSGNGNTGTLINGTAFDTNVGGNLFFDGTNDYVSCGNPTILQNTSGSANVWFKALSPQGQDYTGIIVKQNLLGVFITATKIHIYDWGNSATRDTGVVVTDNVWRNLCVTFSETVGTPSNNAKVYINGSLILTTTIKYVSNSAPLLLGYGNVPYQYLKGNISHASYYNTVLSAAEVLQNYNATKSRYGL